MRKFFIRRETPIHLHGSWLMLIRNVQDNFGVIWHFVLSVFLSSR